MSVWAATLRMAIESWLVLGQMAPYLIFGFLVAGVLSVCVSPAWVERHLGARGLRPVFTASLLGVPLPLCSCGVIPVAASIRRHGASRAATTSFLLSTPQTGVDSIAVTYALLGPVFALFRPCAALLTGLVGGLLVQWFGEPESVSESDTTGRATNKTGRQTLSPSQNGHARHAVVEALRYGLVDLPRDIGPSLLVGILIAGALAALVPPDQLARYAGGGVVPILILMTAGIPLYVCATASVPIAAGFIYLGVSPGAAFAFLVAGPATNAATLATVWKVMGRRTAVLYLGTVAASAIGCGLLLDWLIPTMEAALPQLGHHVHDAASSGWSTHVAAATLLAMLLYSYRAKSAHEHAVAEQTDQPAGGSTEHLELLITGMNCTHCAETVQRTLAEEEGVWSAEVDLDQGRAVIVGEHLDRSRLTAAVAELGYGAHTPDETSAGQNI